MDEEQVFVVMKKIIKETLPELENHSITITTSLKELGANSIDRAEILVRTLAELKLKRPLVEFANAKNIKDIITICIGGTNP